MKILVCVKQVPGSSNVEVDPVTGVLKRNGADTKINPYDLYAIEVALSLCEKYGGEVRAVTMGPPAARAVIEETVCMGTKGGVVLSDRKFAGADVLATAYTLSEGIRRMGEFDLILCGKQTTDGDTAQVGAELSEYLDIPNLSGVLSVEEVTAEALTVTAALDDKNVRLAIKMPCLLSVEGDVNTPRLPSYRVKKTLPEDAVCFFSFADFADQDEKHYGLAGSATQVERIFPPEKNADKTTLGGTPAEQAAALVSLLESKKMI